MSTRISLHKPVFYETYVSKLSSGTYTVTIQDKDRNEITIFAESADELLNFARLLEVLTKAEQTNPYKQEVMDQLAEAGSL